MPAILKIILVALVASLIIGIAVYKLFEYLETKEELDHAEKMAEMENEREKLEAYSQYEEEGEFE